MIDYVGMVQEFMLAHYGPSAVPRRPGLPTSDVTLLRLRLMAEEFGELVCALHDGDLEAVADGVADLLYVVIGTGIAYGLPVDRIFAEVHRSNMSKGRRPLAPGAKYAKSAKGPGYSPPLLAPLLRAAQRPRKPTPYRATKDADKTRRGLPPVRHRPT